jgi:hypothetical protein
MPLIARQGKQGSHLAHRSVRRRTLETDSAEQAGRILASLDRIESRFDAFLKQKMSIVRIRCHGNLHLGQILHTGNDFMIIDFDGEPRVPFPIAAASARRGASSRRCCDRFIAPPSGRLPTKLAAAHSANATFPRWNIGRVSGRCRLRGPFLRNTLPLPAARFSCLAIGAS